LLLVLGLAGFAGADEVELLVRLLQSDDSDLQYGASYRLKQIGASAVPAVAALVKDPYPPLRAHAVYTLGEFGAGARAHAPALLEIAKKDRDADVRAAAFEALARVDPRRALPFLLARLGDDDALAALKALGPEVTAELLQLLGHEQEAVRGAARHALEWFEPPPLDATAPLLRDENPALRREALGLLLWWRWKSLPLLPALTAACADRDPEVAADALEVLAALEEKAAPARAAVERALRRPEAKVRAAAAWAFFRMGDAAVRETAAALIAALRDDDVKVRRAAAIVLGRTKVEAAASELKRLIRDPEVKVDAAFAYWRASGDAATALPVLRAAADVHGLAAMGPAARPAVPDLVAAAKQAEDEWDRIDCAEAILSAGAADEAWAVLRPLFDDEEFSDDGLVTSALAKHGSVADLVRLLQGEEHAWVLEEALVEKGAPAAPAAAKLLAHDDVPVRRSAVRILRRLEKHAAVAAPALVRALRDKDPDVRDGAAEVLGRAGDASTTVVEALKATGGLPATVALWRLGQPREPLLPVLLAARDEWGVDDVLLDQPDVPLLTKWLDDPKLRTRAAEFLARAGAKRELVEPALRDAVSAGNLEVLLWLTWDGLTPLTFDLLRLALGHATPDVRARAVESMADGVTTGGLEDHVLMAEAAVRAWAPLLRDESAAVRKATLEALAEVGPLAAAVVPRLIELLDAAEQIAALDVLRKIGRGAKDAGPHLVRLVQKGRSAPARMRAASALLAMGKAAPDGSFAVLAKAAENDPDERVRYVAGRAMFRIAIEKGNYAIGVGGGGKR